MSDQLAALRTALAEHYVVDRVIGQGGSSTVYLAQDIKLNRDVAIKVLRPEMAESVTAERFMREIKVTAHLQHPHIVTVTESGVAAGLLYFVLPYVHGESLRELLRRTPQLEVEHAVRLTREIADGLAYAHGEGIIHRDIKPENVLLSGGHAVITDFGLAKAMATQMDGSSTSRGVAVGTPLYMSPEQFSGAKDIDARTDQYSLACLFYEMLAGEPPFTGGTVQAVAARHIQQPPPSIRVVRPRVNLAIAAVLERALAKVPADRYQSVADFSAALEQALVSPPARMPLLRRPRALAIALAGVVLIGAWASWRGLRPNASLPLSRVALLELTTPGGAPELVAFAANLTSRLTEELSGFDTASLAVIPHRIIDQYRSDSLNYSRLARRLNVGTLIAGSVTAERSRVHIALQLIDGRNITRLDGFSFVQDVTDGQLPIDVPTESVADSLRKKLGATIAMRRRLLGTENAAAAKLLQDAETRLGSFDAQLEGTDSLRAARRTLSDVDSMYRAAERLDATWIEPIIGQGRLAIRRVQLAALEASAARRRQDVQAWQRAFRTGVSHAERAVTLEPGNPRALFLRGSLLHRISQYIADPVVASAVRDSAAADLRLVLDLSPHHPQALLAWSEIAAAAGRPHEAIQYANSAFEADAFLDLGHGVAQRLFEFNFSYPVEDDSAAMQWCTYGAAHFPARPTVTSCQLELMAWSDMARPDPARARSLAHSTLSCLGCGRNMLAPRLEMLVGVVYARAGQRDSARAVLRRGLARSPSNSETVIMAANILALLGEKERGVELIVAYAAAHPEQHVRMQRSYGLRALRREPRVMLALEPPPRG